MCAALLGIAIYASSGKPGEKAFAVFASIGLLMLTVAVTVERLHDFEVLLTNTDNRMFGNVVTDDFDRGDGSPPEFEIGNRGGGVSVAIVETIEVQR